MRESPPPAHTPLRLRDQKGKMSEARAMPPNAARTNRLKRPPSTFSFPLSTQKRKGPQLRDTFFPHFQRFQSQLLAHFHFPKRSPFRNRVFKRSNPHFRRNALVFPIRSGQIISGPLHDRISIFVSAPSSPKIPSDNSKISQLNRNIFINSNSEIRNQGVWPLWRAFSAQNQPSLSP